jgi:hypothetical protein
VKKPVSKFAFQVHNLRRYTEEEFTGATAEATRALEDVIVVGAVHADSP